MNKKSESVTTIIKTRKRVWDVLKKYFNNKKNETETLKNTMLFKINNMIIDILTIDEIINIKPVALKVLPKLCLNYCLKQSNR